MSNSINVHVHPMTTHDHAVVEMSGTVPVVRFGTFPGTVTIALGNHPDPAAWLRDTALSMLDLAAQVTAAQAAQVPA